ncbi:TPA: MerR family transcriptional regulator [Aeromonas salmonicida]
MYIGEFARLAGTTPKAIRLYEQMGLLPEPRRHGKYRVYRAEDLEWVGFIRQAQQLGCKLSELTPLLAGMTDMAQFPWQKMERLIADRRGAGPFTAPVSSPDPVRCATATASLPHATPPARLSPGKRPSMASQSP